MGERSGADGQLLPKAYRMLLVVVLTTLMMAVVAGGAGAVATTEHQTAVETTETIQSEMLFSEEEETEEEYIIDISDDGIELSDSNMEIEILEAQVDQTAIDDRSPLDVAFVPEESFSMYTDWGTHTPGSGTVDDLVDQEVLGTSSVTDIEQEGLGLNTRGVWKYGTDVEERTVTSWPPWETEEYEWAGWHGDIGSPDGDTTVAHLDEERTTEGIFLEFNFGQSDYSYEIRTDDGWVELPRGTNDGIRGHWEYTEEDDILGVGEDALDGLYHIDLRADLIPFVSDQNDWAFDTTEIGDQHIRLNWEEPVFSFMGDEVAERNSVDREAERYEAIDHILAALNQDFGDQATIVVNGESLVELSNSNNEEELGDNLDGTNDGLEAVDDFSEELNEAFPEDKLDELPDEKQEEFNELEEEFLDLWWFGPDAEQEDADLFSEFTLWDSVETANDELDTITRDSEQAIVIVSDGREPVAPPNDMWDNLFGSWAPDFFTGFFGIDEPADIPDSSIVDANDDRVEQIAANTDATIHTLALGDNPDNWRLDYLAEETGGQSYSVDESDQLALDLGFGGEDVTMERKNPELELVVRNEDSGQSYPSGFTGPATEISGTEEFAGFGSGTTNFGLEVTLCDEYAEGGTTEADIDGLDIDATFDDFEGCDVTGETRTVVPDDPLIFSDGDALSELDEAAGALPSHMNQPSETVPGLFVDDGELDMDDEVLMMLPVSEDEQLAEEYDGYVLAHAQLDVSAIEDTRYEVSIEGVGGDNFLPDEDDEKMQARFDNIDSLAGTEGVVAGETLTVDVNVTNHGEASEGLSEQVSLLANGDVIDSERVNAEDLSENSTTLEFEWETEAGDGGFADQLVVESDRDIETTNDDVHVYRSVMQLVEEEVDLDYEEEVNVTEGDEIEIEAIFENIGFDAYDVSAALHVGETTQSESADAQNLQDVTEGDDRQAELGWTWTPGYADIPDIQTGEDTEASEVEETVAFVFDIEAYDEAVTHTEELTITYDPDDVPGSLEDLDEGELSPVEIEIDDVEFED